MKNNDTQEVQTIEEALKLINEGKTIRMNIKNLAGLIKKSGIDITVHVIKTNGNSFFIANKFQPI